MLHVWLKAIYFIHTYICKLLESQLMSISSEAIITRQQNLNVNNIVDMFTILAVSYLLEIDQNKICIFSITMGGGGESSTCKIRKPPYLSV